MSWESLLAFNVILVAALVSPGPGMLLAVRSAMAGGRRAGLATGAGLGLMGALWTLAALLGLESVFAIAPWSFGALKIGGALYLLWIALQTWRTANASVAQIATPRHGRAFLQGFLVNLGNPKSMLFAGSVIILVFPQGLDRFSIMLVVANHLLLEWLFYTFVAFALSANAPRRGYLRLKPVFNRLVAALLGALGLRLMLEH